MLWQVYGEHRAPKAHTGCRLGSGVAVLGSAGLRPQVFWVRLRVYEQGVGGSGFRVGGFKLGGPAE